MGGLTFSIYSSPKLVHSSEYDALEPAFIALGMNFAHPSATRRAIEPMAAQDR